MIGYIIALVFFITSTIVFVILFIKTKIAYWRLVKKNLNKNETPIELVEKVDFVPSPPIDDSEKRILDTLQHLLEDKHIYLNQNLSINDLAKEIGTNKTALSHVINNHLQVNFPTLLNQYRIKKSIELLTNPKYDNKKIEYIGEMCGYKNRQVFHAAFKKEMGITPIKFRKISQEVSQKENSLKPLQ